VGKKKLTKRERQLRHFKKELAAQEAKKALDNAIEQHLFNRGDLVKVNGKVGVIADYNEGLLERKYSVGVEAFLKAVKDFEELVDYLNKRGSESFPQEFVKVMEDLVPNTMEVIQNFADTPAAGCFVDIPVGVVPFSKGYKVKVCSCYANRQEKLFVVWDGMFSADEMLKLGMDKEEDIRSEEVTEDLDYWRGEVDQTTSGFTGIFEELAKQAYAVKEKRSRNLGLYKVFYSGQMFGQHGKQSVWVAPSTIQGVH
jgi:hypothetical protein